MRIKRIRFLIMMTAFLTATYFACDHGTDIDEVTPPERDFRCGDPNGDGTISILDITTIIGYLYNIGPMVDTIAADVDQIEDISINDVAYMCNYLYSEGLSPECPLFFVDTTIPVSADTIKTSSRIIPPGDSIWGIDISIIKEDDFRFFSLPLSYNCISSDIVCDSVTYAFYGLQKLHDIFIPYDSWMESYRIDTTEKKILFGCPNSGLIPPATDTVFASLWFSVTPSDNPQEIILDTTICKPSNRVIISRYKKPQTIASVPVIIF